MIDLAKEDLMPLAQAAKKYPGGGKHVSQIHRYRMDRETPLICVMVGHIWMTSIESMHRHVRERTALAMGRPVRRPGEPSTADRKSARRRAEKELAAAGI